MTSDHGGISSFGQLRPKTASNSDKGWFSFPTRQILTLQDEGRPNLQSKGSLFDLIGILSNSTFKFILNIIPLMNVEKTISVSSWLLSFMRQIFAHPSTGWKQHNLGPRAQKSSFQAQPAPGLAWQQASSSHMNSHSCCSQLLSAPVRHSVHVPAPPSIKPTAALIMLFLNMCFVFFLVGFHQDCSVKDLWS